MIKKVFVWDDDFFAWLVPIVERLHAILPTDWGVTFKFYEDSDILEDFTSEISDLRDLEQCNRRHTLVFDIFNSRKAEKIAIPSQYFLMLIDYRFSDKRYQTMEYVDKDLGLKRITNDELECYGVKTLFSMFIKKNPDITAIIISSHVETDEVKRDILGGGTGHLATVVGKNKIKSGSSYAEVISHLIYSEVLRNKATQENIILRQKNKVLDERQMKHLESVRSCLTNKIPEEFYFEPEDFLQCIDQLNLALNTNRDVLITGETGVGKDVFAEVIHRCSTNSENKMVRVSCPAFTDTLLDSELFGHVKGAFDGAAKDREGCFAAAQNSTLFLDEVADCSPLMQNKLLHATGKKKTIQRVGEDNEIILKNIRIIYATNKDLKELVNKKEFRCDLFKRINRMHIEIPPLRKRKRSILPLAEKFIAESGVKIPLSKATECILQAHHYPGNVRELEDAIIEAIEMADILNNNEIQPEDLPKVFTQLSSKKNARTITDNQDVYDCPITKISIDTETVKKALKILNEIHSGDRAPIEPKYILPKSGGKVEQYARETCEIPTSVVFGWAYLLTFYHKFHSDKKEDNNNDLIKHIFGTSEVALIGKVNRFLNKVKDRPVPSTGKDLKNQTKAFAHFLSCIEKNDS